MPIFVLRSQTFLPSRCIIYRQHHALAQNRLVHKEYPYRPLSPPSLDGHEISWIFLPKHICQSSQLVPLIHYHSQCDCTQCGRILHLDREVISYWPSSAEPHALSSNSHHLDLSCHPYLEIFFAFPILLLSRRH